MDKNSFRQSESTKALFRWTLGNPSELGFKIFEESLVVTMQALVAETFDWVVCYNNLDEHQFKRLCLIVKETPIKLFQQLQKDCPVSQQNLGSLWKLCPPRLRMMSHEIIMDNDVVIWKRPPEIDEFLESSKVFIPAPVDGETIHLLRPSTIAVVATRIS